jgi:hypothetical protein
MNDVLQTLNGILGGADAALDQALKGRRNGEWRRRL